MKCTPQEFKKYYNLVREGKIKSKIAAKACNYSPTRFCVLCSQYEKIGDRIFIHANMGKKSSRATPLETKKIIIEEYLKVHDDKTNPINFNYWRDELNESYGIKISYSNLWKILNDAGISSPEKHDVNRQPVKRIRFRRENFGELVQWDATPYQFFLWAGDTNYYALHGALDDSSSSLLGLYMTENECRYGYIACRRQVLNNFGIEIEDYSDRSPVFHNNYKERVNYLDKDEQLAGVERKKSLWEVMNQELNVNSILANSPQAKGKIERSWKTIQGRVCNELRKRKIRTLEEANVFFEKEFIRYYNEHFSRKNHGVSVFRPVPENLNLDNLLCVKEKRLVQKTGCISFKGLKFRVEGIKYYGISGDVCINERDVWFLYRQKKYKLTLLSDLHYL